MNVLLTTRILIRVIRPCCPVLGHDGANVPLKQRLNVSICAFYEVHVAGNVSTAGPVGIVSSGGWELWCISDWMEHLGKGVGRH